MELLKVAVTGLVAAAAAFLLAKAVSWYFKRISPNSLIKKLLWIKKPTGLLYSILHKKQ